MKFRLAALVIILSLVLVSCSLAEDITPPPGYKSPTPVPTLASVTPVVESTSTVEPATATSETTPASTQSTTPPADATAKPGTSLGNITGTLVNGSGGGIPEGQNVTLVGLDQDQTGSYQKVLELQSPVNRDGSYSFTGVEVALTVLFSLLRVMGAWNISPTLLLLRMQRRIFPFQ
jgi:outer membrane receptor protein involved in Fe transport